MVKVMLSVGLTFLGLDDIPIICYPTLYKQTHGCAHFGMASPPENLHSFKLIFCIQLLIVTLLLLAVNLMPIIFLLIVSVISPNFFSSIIGLVLLPTLFLRYGDQGLRGDRD